MAQRVPTPWPRSSANMRSWSTRPANSKRPRTGSQASSSRCEPAFFAPTVQGGQCLSQHTVDQGPGIVMDGAQMVLVAQGFGVDLVHVLRARGTHGAPGVVRGRLQSPAGGGAPRHTGE